MPIPTFTGLRPDPTFEDLKVKINTLVKELTNLMLNLDKENIVEVDGDVLIKGTVTAAKMMVEELSAISANLGHITAGLIEAVQIFGSYIATSQSFPRAEMSNTDNMFNVWASEGKGIQMKAFKSGSPYIDFIEGIRTASVYYGAGSGLYFLTEPGEDITLKAGGDVHFDQSNDVSFWSWSDIYSRSTSNTLQDELDSKVDYGSNVTNMTFDPTTRNLKLWNANGSLVAQVNIP